MSSDLKHPNSRPVTLIRAGSFLQRAQGKEILDFYSMSKVSVGAYFINRSADRIASGLSFKEEDILMPYLLDIPADDRDFRKKVREFFAEIDTKVEAVRGTVLETGLESDNTKPISKDNMPIEIIDFVRWRHCLGHPFMAQNQEEAESNPIKQYYIFDPATIQDKKSAKRKNDDTALQLYLQIKEDENKLDMVLTMMGVDVRSFPKKEGIVKKQEELYKFATTKPMELISVASNEKLEQKSWLKKMVNCGILKLIGSKYLNDGKVIGNTEEEAIFFLQDDDNTDIVSVLKAKTQEAMRTTSVDLQKHRKTQPLNGVIVK